MKSSSALLGSSLPVTAFKRQAVTTSQAFAKDFHKRPVSVSRRITQIIDQGFGLFNPKQLFVETDTLTFKKSEYYNYRLSREGFILLTLTYTGKRVQQTKLAYLKEFDRVEAEIQKSLNPPCELPALPSGNVPVELPGPGRYLVTADEDGVRVLNAGEKSLVDMPIVYAIKSDLAILGKAIADMSQRLRVLSGDANAAVLDQPLELHFTERGATRKIA